MGQLGTRLTASVAEVAQPGNTTLSWEGADRWDATPRDRLPFASRLDGDSWSAFEPATSRVLLSPAAGDHTFEVKARDLDFSEDPTPALVHFTVISPIWRQTTPPCAPISTS